MVEVRCIMYTSGPSWTTFSGRWVVCLEDILHRNDVYDARYLGGIHSLFSRRLCKNTPILSLTGWMLDEVSCNGVSSERYVFMFHV